MFQHPHPPPFPPPPPHHHAGGFGFGFAGRGFPPGPHGGPHGHPHPHPHPLPGFRPAAGRGGMGRGGMGWGGMGRGGRGHRAHPYGRHGAGFFFGAAHGAGAEGLGAGAPGVNELSHGETIAQELALEVIERAQLDPSTTEVLDFGFDTNGFYTSRILQPHVKALVGVAIGGDAVEAYDRYANQSNLAPEQMRAVRVAHMGDLAALGGRKFDVVLVAQPIEQRPDIAAAVPLLAQQALKPGGMMFLVSLDLSVRAGAGPLPFGYGLGFGRGSFGFGGHGGGENEAAAADEHLHPERERIQELLGDAGLVTADLARVDSYGFAANEPGRLFVARGVKLQDVENESTIDGDEN